MFLRRLVALLLVLLPVTGVRGAGDTCASSSHIFPYHPCYPQPIAARLKTGERVEYTVCGDKGAGEQHMVWRALAPEEQCWGLSDPERKCSRSTSGEHHCLVGEEWDALRDKLGFIEADNLERVMSLEVGNWASSSTIGAIARILLEEMMDYKVRAVARTGTFGAFERVAREANYMVLEAWQSAQYEDTVKYYVWDHVCVQPFTVNSNGKVAYAIDGTELPVQPASSLVDFTLAIEEQGLQGISLGSFGWEGFLITKTTAERGQNESRFARQWRGYTATVPKEESMLELLPADGTVKCVDRLMDDSVGDCLHPEAEFYCPSDCPSTIWRESSRPESACCVHGRFYPPQCIPAGVTLDDIRKDPDYSSPLCREFLHPDASWNVGYMEALIVNLELLLVVHYVGPEKMRELLEDRTAAGETAIFYWWTPDPLISAIGGVKVFMPPATECTSIRPGNEGNAQLDGPFNSEIKCEKREVPLKKLLRKSRDEDLQAFYLAFDMPLWTIEQLLELSVNYSTDEAACRWVKDNSDRWDSWVFNANAAVPRKRHWYTSDSAKLTLAIIISSVASFCIAVALLARSRLAPSHSLPWDSVKLLDVISIGKLGVTFKARYRGLLVSLKPLFPPPLPQDGVEKHKSGMFAARCFNLMSRKSSPAHRQFPINDLEAAAVGAFVNGWKAMTTNGRQLTDSTLTTQASLGVGPSKGINSIAQRLISQEEITRTVSFGPFSGSSLEMLAASLEADDLQAKDEVAASIEAIEATFNLDPRPVDPLPSLPSLLFETKEDGRHVETAPTSRSEMQRILEKEMAVLATVRHPNLCSFLGETTSYMGIQYAVIEYTADLNSLSELIHNPSIRVENDVLLSIMKNVADGMNYLHLMQPPVLHGNLKCTNVLVDEYFIAKVDGFGISSKRFVRTDEAGDLMFYTPLEVKNETQPDKSRTKAADVFSFGRMVYELFVNIKPVDIPGMSGRRKSIGGELRPAVSSDRLCSGEPLELNPLQCEHADIRALVRECQHINPDARPTFSDIVSRLDAFDTATFSDRLTILLGSQRLLDSMLPPHVAQQLAAGEKAQPEHFDLVTIFFSDIVGFTSIAQELKPEQVMVMLDNLYGKFDDLVKKHDLFKVETIGDAYMCVGNLRSRQPDHAHRIARFAMDAVDAASATLVDESDPSRGFISIRAGFHSGPVVASVVGTTNPRYCLFGDTVNVASRMESTSKANCIHLSDSSRHILTPASTGEIPLVFRGNLTIKGKGSMVTYWILGYHPAADSHVSDSAPLNLSAPARLDSSNELRRKKNWAEFLASRLEASGGRVGMSGGEIGGSHRGSLPVRE